MTPDSPVDFDAAALEVPPDDDNNDYTTSVGSWGRPPACVRPTYVREHANTHGK